VLIAIVIDAIYPYSKGGREKRLFELSTRLVSMGHDVHIYCMHWWEGPRDRVEHGVHLHAISKFHPQYSGKRRSIKQGILFGLACLKMMNRQFDIIDVDHMPYFPVFSVWLVCALRGRRMFGTWHEALKYSEWATYMGVGPGTIAAIIERMSVRLPDVITANSCHTRQLIVSELRRSRGLVVVSPGVDAAAIAKVEKAATPIDVLYAGRLVKDKNVDLLVLSIKKVSLRKPDIQCVIIGSGVEEESLREQILRLGLKRNVRLIPFLDEQDDVYSYMKASRVFAFPSRREGFGVVVLEALACGIPVVTVDVPSNGSKHLVHEGVNGSIVPPSSSAFASALEEWLRRDVEKSSIVQSAASYDWDRLARRQAEVYAEGM